MWRNGERTLVPCTDKDRRGVNGTQHQTDATDHMHVLGASLRPEPAAPGRTDVRVVDDKQRLGLVRHKWGLYL